MNSLRVDSLYTKQDGVFKCLWSEAFFEAITSKIVVKLLKEFLTTFLNKRIFQMKETIIKCEKAVVTAYYKFENPKILLTSQELKAYEKEIYVDKEKMNGSHVYLFNQTKVGKLIK